MKKLPLCLTAFLVLFASQGFAAPERMKDEASGIDFVRIPGGCYFMGSAAAGELMEGLPIRAPGVDEVPRHEVCVDSFWLGRSEVTQAQRLRLMSATPSGWDDPVNNVTWHEAMAFIAKLNASGKGRFRLPTEAEWEYACHAGTIVPVTQPSGGERLKLLEDTNQTAVYRYAAGNNPKVRHAMAKKPNAWGLHDMLGNVWEWTIDGYDPGAYAHHARTNPQAAAKDDRRVIRGGSYKSDIAHVRCGARSYAPVEERSPVIGFRVVRELDQIESEGRK